MSQKERTSNLPALYHADEVAWVEQMAALAAAGEAAALDLKHLCEYLNDMAKREQREVLHAMATLFVHLLKWEYQAQKRTRSWDLTIQEQRAELQDLLESEVLRNYARQEPSRAYQRAARRAAVEAELAAESFPMDCPYTLEQAVGE